MGPLVEYIITFPAAIGKTALVGISSYLGMIQIPVQNEFSLLSPVLETGSRFFADSSWQLPSKQSRKRLFSMASTLSEFRLLEEVNTLKDSVHWNSKKKLTS